MKTFIDRFASLPSFGLLVLALASSPNVARADWSTNPAVNNPVCTDYYNQSDPEMIRDGSGGTIVVWVDSRFQSTYRLFAQRIDANGNNLWAVDGVQVSSASINNTGRATVVSDGNGGAIVCWSEAGAFGDLYAQRIDSNGALLWPGGVLICSGTVAWGEAPQLCSDGNGGAILAWGDMRPGDHMIADLYAQRVNAAGVVQWAANGAAVCTASEFQGVARIASDGAGGAIMVWEDSRDPATIAIYAQRISAIGASLWTPGGVLLNSVPGGSLYAQLVNDGGGAIVAWVDRRLGQNDWNIYAQRISASGAVAWTENGVAMSLAAGSQTEPRLVSDDSGGAIVTWDSPVSAGNPTPDIHAQRVNSSGAVQWTANGISVCSAANGQFLPEITSDGNGGAVITWHDSRTNNIHDIYAQRIDGTGAPVWVVDGIAVSTATFVQRYPMILNDGTNGVIVAWPDFRNDLGGNRNDIFAQRVRMDGTLGGPTPVSVEPGPHAPAVSLAQNYPNPFRTATTIAYTLAKEGHVSLKLYDVSGREVATLVDGVESTGPKSVKLNAGALPCGVYMYRLQAGAFVESKELVVIR